MAYVDRVLLPQERVVYRGKVHWVRYIPALWVLLLAVILAIFASDSALPFDVPHWVHWTRARVSGAQWVRILCYLFFALGVWMLVRACVEIYTTELVVTDRRVIAKFGVAEVTTVEMDRLRIAGVVVHQTAWGRVLNYGTVWLRGFSGDIGGLPPIRAPYELQQHINRRFHPY